VRVDPTGTVTAAFGLACHGQGTDDAGAGRRAELGVATRSGSFTATRTRDRSAADYASRSAVIGGGAAMLATARSGRKRS
jgi:CO/xanthine dehydrogenase Mo-binding subunit